MSIKDLINIEEKESYTDELFLVRSWMTPDPCCVRPEHTIRKAVEIMDQLDVDDLPLIDEGGILLGMVNSKALLHYLLQDNQADALVSIIPHQDFVTALPTDSILKVSSLPYNSLPVVNEQRKLVGVITKRDIIDGFTRFVHKLQQQENNAEVLRVILESAYEGVAVVDEYGILLEFNEAYSRFTGIKREDAVGRHVTEVIDNTNLHITVKTAIPERGVVQNIQGQDMVVHRIPIWKEGKVAGAIGMLIFEGVTEVYKLYEGLQKDHISETTGHQPLTVKLEEDSRMTLDQIIGSSEGISNVKRLARRAARTTATVLITGESGTGKELFAKSIHHLSPFGNGPFISVNCGAIPDNLFESELFGYESGAFTGAKQGGKPGKFELAHNGTIFLDEIGEMPLVMQTKLLRVLQEKEAERVGGLDKYQINVRVVAATNRNIKEMVEKGEFREDLYYRLNIIQLHIPPLRERKQDIPILLSYYTKKVCEKYRTPVKSFVPETVSLLMNYHWRGNIREMVNTVERLVTFTDGQVIKVNHLPDYIREEIDSVTDEKKPSHSPHPSLIQEAKLKGEEREKEMIIKALKNAEGNKSNAAQLLGIHRTTLYQKLRKYDIKL